MYILEKVILVIRLVWNLSVLTTQKFHNICRNQGRFCSWYLVGLMCWRCRFLAVIHSAIWPLLWLIRKSSTRSFFESQKDVSGSCFIFYYEDMLIYVLHFSLVLIMFKFTSLILSLRHSNSLSIRSVVTFIPLCLYMLTILLRYVNSIFSVQRRTHSIIINYIFLSTLTTKYILLINITSGPSFTFLLRYIMSSGIFTWLFQDWVRLFSLLGRQGWVQIFFSRINVCNSDRFFLMSSCTMFLKSLM